MKKKMKKKVLFTVVTVAFVSVITACGGETKDIAEDTNRSQEVITPSVEPVDVPETVEPTAEPAPEVTETAMKDWYIGTDMECKNWDVYGVEDAVFIQMSEDATSVFNENMEVTFYNFNYNGVEMNICVETFPTKPGVEYRNYESAPYYNYEELSDSSSIESYVAPNGSGSVIAKIKNQEYRFHLYIKTVTDDSYDSGYRFIVNLENTLREQIQ